MTSPILAIIIPPDHDWTFWIGDWVFGLQEYAPVSGIRTGCTRVYLGPTSFQIPGASLFQVIGATGLVVAVLIALAVFLVTHRRASRSPR